MVRTAAAMLVLAGGLWTTGAGAVEVKNVKAEYAWPWGAEIQYELEGTLVPGEPFFITAMDCANNAIYYNATYYVAADYALFGDTGTQAGAHKVKWDLDQQGIKLQSTNVVFKVGYLPCCVVDLSGGANASSYPVTYMDEPPSGGFNTSTYQTTKLVLRKIPAGTFMMNGTCQVTLTKSFYIGIFEVTQKQYALVMGSNPSDQKDDRHPVERVSYNDIRGSSSGSKWPTNNAVDASSFLGKLRAKTGLKFDLPTEAQWEYACRAGTTSKYNNGGNEVRDLSLLGRWNSSGLAFGSHNHTTVGSYKSNAWGLYDMHGNISEWCLDWYGTISAGSDPKGASSGSYRVFRGGSFYTSSAGCASGFRDKKVPDNRFGFGTYGDNGFRLCLPSDQ